MPRNFKNLIRVAVAGRRNVGKSTLLNALYGRRRAITDEIAGLTRDILEVEIDRPPYNFLLSDTPGLDIENPGKLEGKIISRAFDYIKSVDLVLFLLEAPSPGKFDFEFIELFRKNNIKTPVLYVVNKVDGKEQMADGMAEFFSLGLDPLIAVSAIGRWNLDVLLQEIAKICPAVKNEDQAIKNSVDQNSPDQKIKFRNKKYNKLHQEKEKFGYQNDVQKTDPLALIDQYDLPDQNPEDETEEWISLDNNDHPPGFEKIESDKKKSDLFGNEFENLNQIESMASNEFAEIQNISSQYALNKDQNIQHGSSVISDSRFSETRIALVGRPNAGKSSIFNRLTNRDIAVVSEVPGTTRDTMDTVFQFHGEAIRIMDTAGLRKSAKYIGKDSVEFYSVARTKRAIRDARVVIHIIDTTQGITDYDKKISAQIRELHRPVILAFNKWDIIANKNNDSIRDYLDRFRFLFPQIHNMPVVFCSALTGKRVSELIKLGLDLDKKMKTRISTGALNGQIKTWLKHGPTSSRNLRVYYVSQVETEPPAFVFFVNRKSLFRENLRIYLENKIRNKYKLQGVPIDLLVRERKSEDRPRL